MGVFTKRGAVRVELMCGKVRPGETVAGVVCVDVAKAIDSGYLMVRLVGEETMMWKRKIGASTAYHLTTKKHVDQEIALAPEGTSFTIGETQFPISFHLPDAAVSSFSYAAKNVHDLLNVHVAVQYKVEVSLKVKGFGRSTLEGHAVFIVDPPREVAIPKLISVTKSDQVKFLALFKKGSCDLALDVPTDVFAPTSSIDVHVGLQLENPASLRDIALVLYEDAVVDRHMAIFTGLKSGSRVVCRRVFDEAALGQFPTNAQKAQFMLSLPITPNLVATDELPLNPTMVSHFLTLSYRVAVECRFSLARQIRIEAPVRIVRELTVAPAKFGAPLGEMAFEATKQLVMAIIG